MDTEIKPSTPPLAKTETSEITKKLATDTHELKTDNDMKKEENEIKLMNIRHANADVNFFEFTMS